MGEALSAGIGFDAHRLEAGRELHLGGLLFPGEMELAGHSDGDAALHAVIDALLGAARLGDVGALFPPGDEKWRDADSAALLAAAVERMHGAGWRPAGLDVVIVARRPAIEPRRSELVKRLAELTGLEPEAVSVKGTTSDRPRFRRSGGDRCVRRCHGGSRLTEWIGGRRPVAEALAARRDARRLLVSKSARPSPELKQMLSRAREASVPVETVPGDRIAALAGFDGHQGVLLEVGERRWADLSDMLARAEAAGRDPLVLLLERLPGSDELRHPAALGRGGRRRRCGLPERGAAPLSAAAVKASAGASEHLLLARVESLGHALRDLQERGVRVVAADQDAPASAWDTDLSGPLAVIVGAEGEGISGATRRRVDLLVSFPMSGKVASLNAATAGALLLFEIVRQRSGSHGR